LGAFLVETAESNSFNSDSLCEQPTTITNKNIAEIFFKKALDFRI